MLSKWAFTFTGENAATTIADEMPAHYQMYFSALSVALFINSLLAFVASYFELAWAQKLSTFTGLLTTIVAIILAVVNEVTSNSILGRMVEDEDTTAQRGRQECLSVIAQLNQGTLMSLGCPAKYTSTSFGPLGDSSLKCAKNFIASVWEPNVGRLVQDHTQQYGCLNVNCCEFAQTFIDARFNLVTVALIVLALFLLHFIVNQQYMLKIISKYEARILQHNYDCVNFGILVALALTFGII